MSKPTHEKLFLGDIEVPAGRRSLNEATVRDIADSMRAVGQLQPITVIDTGESYRLISGAHRVAAARLIADAIPFEEWEDHPGIGSINAIVLPHNWDGNPRLIEISENLHRAELTALERSELTAEWIRLTSPADKLFQVETVSAKGGRGKEGGVNAAARELGISKADAHRAVKVAALSAEAKEAARDAGLADNQAALLGAAKEKEPERQVAAIREHSGASVPRVRRAMRTLGFLGGRPRTCAPIPYAQLGLTGALSTAPRPTVRPTCARSVSGES